MRQKIDSEELTASEATDELFRILVEKCLILKEDSEEIRGRAFDYLIDQKVSPSWDRQYREEGKQTSWQAVRVLGHPS